VQDSDLLSKFPRLDHLGALWLGIIMDKDFSRLFLIRTSGLEIVGMGLLVELFAMDKVRHG
jgi:hypothetical protein